MDGQIDAKFIIIYWIVLGAVVFIEHRVFAHRWRHYELARRTMGIATVMLGALPLVLTGIVDPLTWGILFIAFGVCGAIVGALYTHEAAGERQARVDSLKRLMQTHAEAIYETDPSENPRH